MFPRATIAILLVAAVPALAQVVSYEAISLFPEQTDDGWVRLDTLYPGDRWFDGGFFVQYAEVVAPGPPELPEQDHYRRELDDMAGSLSFFMHWAMQADGPREGIEAVAPAVITASGQMGIRYHFTMAEDRVRFIDSDSVFWWDIDPGVHHYYLEVYPDQYHWYIDGEVIVSGTPAGPYPTTDSFIVFGARAAGPKPITDYWDFVRFGLIPETSGDYNSDGQINSEDFYFFEECFSGADADAGPSCRWADFDGDTDVDFHDFSRFQLAFTGPE